MDTDVGGDDLAGQAIRNTLWATVAFFSAKLATFGATIILARLLVPEEFGVVAIVLLSIQYLEVVNDAGMGAALITRTPSATRAPDTAFTLNCVVSAALYAIAWATAPIIATFFDEPEVTDLLRVLALVLPLQGLGAVPQALAQRALAFRRLAGPEVIKATTKGLVSIWLASTGAGAWALIWGQLAGQAVAVVLFFVVSGYRPRPTFDRNEARILTRFGKHIVGIGLLSAIASNIDYVIVGQRLGVVELGFYSIAFRVPELVIQSLARISSTVAHPVLSRAITTDGDHRQVFAGYLRGLVLVSFPVGIGLALVSPLVVSVVFGETWNASGPVMAAICVALTISSMQWVSGALYKATDRPELLHRVVALRLPPTVAALLIGSNWGIVGVAIGQVVAAACNLVLELVVARSALGVPLRSVAEAVRPAATATAVMALVVGGAVAIVDPATAIWLAALGVTGAAVYALTLRLAFPDVTATHVAGLVAALRPSPRR